MGAKFQTIKVDPICEALILYHRDNKNHRILKVLRTLCLRLDFQIFLEQLREECIYQKEIIIPLTGKPGLVWDFDDQIRSKLISNYLDKIHNCTYYLGLDGVKKVHFDKISSWLLQHSFIWTMVNERQKGLFHNTVDVNSDFNYPNISLNVYDRELFKKVFDDAFYSNFDDIRNKYGGHPLEFTSGSVLDEENFEKFSKLENFKLSKPKVGVIIFDDDTDKTELIDYINKVWGDYEFQLKGLRPPKKEKRVSSSANFLRDIEIFNMYQKFKDEGFKNPDVKVYTWLKSESEYKVEIEPNTIRKIVSELNTEIEEINS